MSAVLSVTDLSFGYRGDPFLRGVRLELAAGELVALLGPNGSGKTTLLRLVGGLLKPGSGEVRIGSRPLGDLTSRERSRWVSFLPQRSPQADGFAVHEVVLMGLYSTLPARGWESHREWRLVVEALRRVGAAPLLRRPFGELSGGEQRRVLLARALVAKPRVLLLDEPLASLDPGFQLELIGQLRVLKREGTAIVAATHHLDLVRELADRVLLLRGGQVLASGQTREVMTPGNLDSTYGTDAFSQRGSLGSPGLAMSA